MKATASEATRDGGVNTVGSRAAREIDTNILGLEAPVLQAQRLVIGYPARRRTPEHRLLPALDLSLVPGTLTALVGTNGVGKSTLLRTLVGAQSPLSGHVLVRGRPLSQLRPEARATAIGIVTSEQPDLGLLRARDVVAMGRQPHTGWTGRLSAADREVVDAVMAQTGVDELADRDTSTLSDGERQRVMVARALAQQPAVLVLDEPTAFLDVRRRVELTRLLSDLARTQSVAVLLCSHDLHVTLPAADVVWLIDETSELHIGSTDELADRMEDAFGMRVA